MSTLFNDVELKPTMHPNGRVFHTKYNAKPNKKAAARLAKRKADYAKTISGGRNYSGYHCPGSMSK